jgi:hypothetical protein
VIFSVLQRELNDKCSKSYSGDKCGCASICKRHFWRYRRLNNWLRLSLFLLVTGSPGSTSVFTHLWTEKVSPFLTFIPVSGKLTCGIRKLSTQSNQMKEVPLYVLDPRGPQSDDDYAKGREAYTEITEIEPGSELAKAVVRLERQHEASYDRLRKIAAYLCVKL